jgi:methyl-accepting chemotaxis protein
MQGDQQATQTIQQVMQAAEQGDQQAQQLAQMIQQVAEQMKG